MHPLVYSLVLQYRANLFLGLLISTFCVPLRKPWFYTYSFPSPWKHFPEPLAFNRGLSDRSIKELLRIIGNYSKPQGTITQKTIVNQAHSGSRNNKKTMWHSLKNVHIHNLGLCSCIVWVLKDLDPPDRDFLYEIIVVLNSQNCHNLDI